MSTDSYTTLRHALLFALVAITTPTATDRERQSTPAEWMSVAPGGETGCGHGSRFEFWVREADPRRMLIYLQGGGACWDFVTCSPGPDITFDWRITTTDHQQREHGIFDRSDPSNPFRDYSAVFIPYCTGDFHLGTRLVAYRRRDLGDSTVFVNHVGFLNVQAVLRHLVARRQQPETVFVIGGSAGAIASPFVASEVANLLPNAAVRQLGDGAGAARFTATRTMLTQWGADSMLAARGAPLVPNGDPLVGMYLTAARRHPRIRFSQVNTSEDANVARWLRVFGDDPARTPAYIAQTYQQLRAAGVCFVGYVLPGTEHTVLWRSTFRNLRVNGEPLPALIERDVLRYRCASSPGDSSRDAVGSIGIIAADLLASTTPAQRAHLQFEWPDSARTSWSYIPGERPGLTLKRMAPQQRRLTQELLRAVLSHAGYLKVNSIMGLENYLQVVERGSFPRDPEAYVLALFGTPGDSLGWALRFEGHHVSVNVTFGGGATAVTPFFLGANPAVVPTGPQAGFQVLADEARLAFWLLSGFSPAQRRRAIVAESAPPDVFTRNDAIARKLEPVGLPVSEMTADQRKILHRLIRVYVDNVAERFVASEWPRIRDHDPATLRFAWFGGSATESPHYYRISGDFFLIEYDHIANHVHTVWRDLQRDFGLDVLRDHHRRIRHESRGVNPRGQEHSGSR